MPLRILRLLSVVIVALGTTLPIPARSYASGQLLDTMDLQQIGHASLIYAQGNQDRLPPATDIWDHARYLAAYSGLDDTRAWQSAVDPATAATHRIEHPVLLPRQSPDAPPLLTPKFRRLKLSYAVPLGKLHAGLPPTTPILWTRGLQPDGTWAAHSPYGTQGGLILFLGGNVRFLKNLSDDGGQLIARDGSKTSNILDALPPGTRISEYIPTPEEQAAWSAQKRVLLSHASTPSDSSFLLLPIGLLWSPFVILSVHRFRNKRPGRFTVLLWPFLIIAIYLLIT